MDLESELSPMSCDDCRAIISPCVIRGINPPRKLVPKGKNLFVIFSLPYPSSTRSCPLPGPDPTINSSFPSWSKSPLCMCIPPLNSFGKTAKELISEPSPRYIRISGSRMPPLPMKISSMPSPPKSIRLSSKSNGPQSLILNV